MSALPRSQEVLPSAADAFEVDGVADGEEVEDGHQAVVVQIVDGHRSFRKHCSQKHGMNGNLSMYFITEVIVEMPVNNVQKKTSRLPCKPVYLYHHV
jgi:hypothetical protein